MNHQNTYRDIIKKEIEKLSKKKSPKEKKYRKWVIGQLIADLQDFETGGQKRWEREPCINFDGDKFE